VTAELGDGSGRLLRIVRRSPVLQPEDRQLARALARMVGVTVRFLEVVAAERALRDRMAEQAEALVERQRFTERLMRIQRSIARRTPLDEILHAIVIGARDLLGDEVVGLRLRDPSDPTHLVVVAQEGVPEAVMATMTTHRADQGISGAAYTSGRPVISTDYLADTRRLGPFSAAGLQASMAVPVLADGELLGSLTVGTYQEGRTYSATEQELLVSLADHAGIALANAHTLDALREALSDPLTGLPNRALLIDRLNQALDRARRGGHRVAVLFIDLDRFKHVNDSLGHAVGDELLCVAANRIRDAVRDADTTARLGGDEFVVVLDDLTERDAAYAARRILQRLREPVEIGGRTLYVGASIGIAICGHHETDADIAIRHADIAMYRAKAAGKDRYVLFEESMHEEVVELLELEAELRAAVVRGDIDVHVQPVIDVATGRVHGVEALARWTSPSRGVVPAPLFVRLAEESGSIVLLDRCVIAKACAMAAPWRDEHTGQGLALHVNCSSRQLESPDFPAFLLRTLEACGLEPSRLVLEITESQVMKDAPGTVDRLWALKALGV
jgi:diguanylate cyclase (GGDEF)-like protein